MKTEGKPCEGKPQARFEVAVGGMYIDLNNHLLTLWTKGIQMITGPEFEKKCTQIAHLLWPFAHVAGSIMAGGRERDGVFITEECVHLLEYTELRTKDKAEKDGKKLSDFIPEYQRKYPDKGVKGWFITSDEPTADQKSAILKEKNGNRISAISFETFKSKLVNVPEYFSCRDNYNFGSVKDPGSSSNEPKVGFVQNELIECGSGDSLTPDELLQREANGERWVFLGEYGSGKSMTLRYFYNHLKQKYLAGKISQFPIHINLRDHNGQDDSSEIIERHCKKIGYSNSGHLVRAWRAGLSILLLDGFDELAPLSFTKHSPRFKEVRKHAMLGIKKLISETPRESKVIVVGRSNYFDDIADRCNCIGIDSYWKEFQISDFTESQMVDYLHRYDIRGKIPTWMPKRPLLIGYLASHGIIKELLSHPDEYVVPAQGWDHLISLICKRESEIEISLDGDTVRQVLERISTTARKSSNGLGPLFEADFTKSFESIVGNAPDKGSFNIIQRLPGIGIDNQIDGSRKFIDADLCDACRAGDLIKVLLDPYGKEKEIYEDSLYLSGNTCIDMVVYKIEQGVIPKGQIIQSINMISKLGKFGVLKYDFVQLAKRTGTDIDSINLNISGIDISRLELDDWGFWKNITFSDCFVNDMYIDADDLKNMPSFNQTYISNIYGINPEHFNEIKDHMFMSCEVENIHNYSETNKQIFDLSLCLPEKLLLSILRKVFIQRGKGRVENALTSGVETGSQKYAADILAILQKYKYIYPTTNSTERIWHANRDKQDEVKEILKDPIRSKYQVQIDTRNLR